MTNISSELRPKIPLASNQKLEMVYEICILMANYHPLVTVTMQELKKASYRL